MLMHLTAELAVDRVLTMVQSWFMSRQIEISPSDEPIKRCESASRIFTIEPVWWTNIAFSSLELISMILTSY